MDHFEYITMVVSFVTAFAVSQVLAGWGRQFALRESQPPYALHTVSSILFLITLVQSIWGSWIYRDVPWTFGTFLVYFASTLPLAGAAVLIHPPATWADSTSLRAHYFSSGRAAYLLIAIWIAMAGLLEWLLTDHLGRYGENTGQLLAVRILTASVLTIQSASRNPKVHWAGLTLLVSILLFFALRFAEFTTG
ncbi:MAG: hypothetical protein NXI30_07215 [bacterium]|nr:hypothetical protein [bacterium]